MLRRPSRPYGMSSSSRSRGSIPASPTSTRPRRRYSLGALRPATTPSSSSSWTCRNGRPSARLAQIGVTYRVPGEGYRGEVPPIDVTVEYTTDEALASSVDPEVMGYVQQRNVDSL